MRAVLPLVLTGCFGSPTGPGFGDPSLLGPLEAVNLAPAVDAPGEDPYPEVLSMVAGHDDENDRYYAHARGFVAADAADVWLALRDLDVVADRRAVDEYALIGDNTLPEFDFSFVIANEVDDIINVSYEMTWVHELQEGSIGTPEEVVVRWDKTDGTAFIDLLAGSVVIRHVQPGVTEVEFIEHLRAAARDEETLEIYLTDLFADVVAHVHGDPLPDVSGA